MQKKVESFKPQPVTNVEQSAKHEVTKPVTNSDPVQKTRPGSFAALISQ
jgi:hypothetical protein